VLCRQSDREPHAGGWAKPIVWAAPAWTLQAGRRPEHRSLRIRRSVHSKGGVAVRIGAWTLSVWLELESVGLMDDLERELKQDADLQDAIRFLADRLGNANLDELQAAAERNDLEAIAKALDLPSVDRLEALAAFLRQRAEHYKQYPDLEHFARRRA
jgi:hypothetical protein